MKTATLLLALLCTACPGITHEGSGDNAPEEDWVDPADAGVAVVEKSSQSSYACYERCAPVLEDCLGQLSSEVIIAEYGACYDQCLDRGDEIGSPDSQAALWLRSWHYGNYLYRDRDPRRCTGHPDGYCQFPSTTCDQDMGTFPSYSMIDDSHLIRAHQFEDVEHGRCWYPAQECYQACEHRAEAGCQGFNLAACQNDCTYWHYNPIAACEMQWVSLNACRRENIVDCRADGSVYQPGCDDEHMRWLSCAWSGGTSPAGAYPWRRAAIGTVCP